MSREQFELWAEGRGYDTYRSEGVDDYYFHTTQLVWNIWESAKEAQEANLLSLSDELSVAQNNLAEMDDALCKLLPGVQCMDPPDGGSVTPLEQVRRMVADYRERLKAAEGRCDHRSKFWDVSGVQRCTLCDKAICNDGEQQTAELVAAGIITKVGE